MLIHIRNLKTLRIAVYIVYNYTILNILLKTYKNILGSTIKLYLLSFSYVKGYK